MKRFSYLNALIALFLIFGMTITSCKKDPWEGPIGPVDDGTLVDVSFSPTLNGEVVPWNASSKKQNGKGDGTFPFTHRYSAHIIRVISGNGAWSTDPGRWVMDIPLVPQNANGTGNDSYAGTKLPKGNFQCRVLPVNVPGGDLSVVEIRSASAADPDLRIPYTPFYVEDQALDATFDMASFESDNVPFAIVTSASQTIPMKLFTRQALMILDLGNDPGWTYAAQNVSEPLLQFVIDGAYLDGSSTAPHSLNYDVLNPMHVAASGTVGLKSISVDNDGMQYFKYFVPGLKNTYNTPGVHSFLPIAKATYLRFGDENAPTSMPAIWLRDYFADGELKANMVVRVKYSIGTFTFTTERLTWFGTNVDLVDGDIPPAEVPMTIEVINTPYVIGEGVEDLPGHPGYRAGALTANVTGGTAPIVITWWEDAAATIPATSGGTQITGVIGYPFSSNSGDKYAKATSASGAFVISSVGVTAYNLDLAAPTFTTTSTSVTATGVGGFGPYTFTWYDAATGGTLLKTETGSTSTYSHAGNVGSYYVMVVDAAQQTLQNRVLGVTIAPLADPTGTAVSANSGDPNSKDINLLGSAIPSGGSGSWVVKSNNLSPTGGAFDIGGSSGQNVTFTRTGILQNTTGSITFTYTVTLGGSSKSVDVTWSK